MPVKSKVVRGEGFKCQEKHPKPLQLACIPQRELQARRFPGTAEMSVPGLRALAEKEVAPLSLRSSDCHLRRLRPVTLC